ncbi:Transcriptional regulatory protein WalR [Luteitalea pratensis]|uniref:Phosphate regulon transcriptional regulatory protein PhoB n=1 Tax=Luteitalea pratensis TaxID=1855912 RepID=A0A143PK67_LUTPR|nr:response regulator transcription factor [Luteitalea pratensis]AMY08640.1 Transcriptional regulatory protein WalR [Luteitalea pratensis]
MIPSDGRRVLVVEDDASIRELLQLHLGLAGFAVEDLGDGRQALDVARATAFDLLVLDVMLPGLDGISLCRAVRTAGPNTNTPILMLTARDSEADIVVGLDSGADDYLTKPFGVRELQARIGAVMRRHQPPDDETQAAAPSTVLQLSTGITLDVERRQVLVHGSEAELTRQEFDLLHQLVARRGIVFSRARLLQTVWSGDAYVTERTVDTVVSRLRKKLETDPRQPALILTAWGVGYKFADLE